MLTLRVFSYASVLEPPLTHDGLPVSLKWSDVELNLEEVNLNPMLDKLIIHL